jgi:hypothetical protein
MLLISLEIVQKDKLGLKLNVQVMIRLTSDLMMKQVLGVNYMVYQKIL